MLFRCVNSVLPFLSIMYHFLVCMSLCNSKITFLDFVSHYDVAMLKW